MLPRRRGCYGAERLNKADRIAAAAPVHVEEAVSLSSAAATQIRENDVGGKGLAQTSRLRGLRERGLPQKSHTSPTRGLTRIRARRLPPVDWERLSSC